MHASRVIFSQKTQELLRSPIMNSSRKVKLRRQRVIEFIHQLPNGEATMADLIAAAGYDVKRSKGQYTTGWSFVNRLIQKNVITPTELEGKVNGRVKQWAVNADVKTTKPAEEPQKEEVAVEEEDEAEPEVERPSFEFNTTSTSDFNAAATGWMVQHAKEYAWRNDSNSLRHFVAWMESRL